MDHEQAGAMWDGNAEAWTKLARQGYDVCRDYINTPAFLAMLPEVAALSGLDIGCGEGHNTRLLARRGASMSAVDISPKFVELAREEEQKERLGIAYRVASAVELPFADEAFDFAVAFMSLMDMPDLDPVLREAFRVVKAGGFLQFSITPPCSGVGCGTTRGVSSPYSAAATSARSRVGWTSGCSGPPRPRRRKGWPRSARRSSSGR
jgi:ubiquinone/menaquinone biosynthesis C-methylase UbiE